MFMSDITGALKRRWVLALVCLGLMVTATGFVMRQSGPTYSYTATGLLLPPSVSRVKPATGPDYTRGNPLFFLDSLNQSRDILIGSLTSSGTQIELRKAFPDVDYKVTPDLLGSGPLVVLTTKSSSDAAAKAAIDALVALAPQRLGEVQSQLGVAQNAQITLHVLSKDSTPAVSHKAEIRKGIEVAAALGLLSVFLIGGVDSILVARERRRRDSAASQEVLPDEVVPDEVVPDEVVHAQTVDEIVGVEDVDEEHEDDLVPVPSPLPKVPRGTKSKRRTGAARQSAVRSTARGRAPSR